MEAWSTDMGKKSSKDPDDVKIFIDTDTVVTITSSANSYIDQITTELSKKIGSELEEADKGAEK
jgi:hypothetical protein